MKLYDKFHGHVPQHNIGKELRKIVKQDKKSFKILTGYGSSTGYSSSRTKAFQSLKKMLTEGLIKGYFHGGVKNIVLDEKSPFYTSKLAYEVVVKYDKDYGNDGIVFIFV